MRAYDESYRDEIVETQGELFENASSYSKGMDIRNFIETYMKSRTREFIDEAQPYVATMDAAQLWDYFVKTDNFKPQEGDSIGGFIPNWIGQFYAYFQWYYDIASRDIAVRLPLDFMIPAYKGLHDLDLELAVKKVGENING